MQEKVIRTHIEENQKKTERRMRHMQRYNNNREPVRKKRTKQKQRAAHEHWGDGAPIDEASAGSSALLSANQ